MELDPLFRLLRVINQLFTSLVRRLRPLTQICFAVRSPYTPDFILSIIYPATPYVRGTLLLDISRL